MAKSSRSIESNGFRRIAVNHHMRACLRSRMLEWHRLDLVVTLAIGQGRRTSSHLGTTETNAMLSNLGLLFRFLDGERGLA